MVNTVMQVLSAGMLLVALMAIVRAYRGPSALDRVVAVNVITTSVVFLILFFAGLAKQSSYYIDVALVFVLASFIATLCILKLLREGRLM